MAKRVARLAWKDLPALVASFPAAPSFATFHAAQDSASRAGFANVTAQDLRRFSKRFIELLSKRFPASRGSYVSLKLGPQALCDVLVAEVLSIRFVPVRFESDGASCCEYTGTGSGNTACKRVLAGSASGLRVVSSPTVKTQRCASGAQCTVGVVHCR